jgi:diguanylate cyclase (GGDEF)-like protein
MHDHGILRQALKFVAVVALTAALAWVGLSSGRGAGHVPAIWWANAGLASIMLLDRRRRWGALLAAGYLGHVIAHILFRDPLWAVLLLSACDTGESAIAAYGVTFSLTRRVDLTRQRQLLRFVAFAVLLGPLAASVAAGLVLHLAQGSPLTVLLRWFPASALGMSIIVPVSLGLARRETRELFHPGRLSNTLLYLLMIAAATLLIFSSADFALLFLIFPPLLFLVVRLGLGGGALGCCIVAAIGTRFTVAAHGGPLAHLPDASIENRILMLQLFLATAVLSVNVVAIVLADLKRATAAAFHNEERYRRLATSMEELATIDALTGVANRRQFDRVIAAEWQRAHRQREQLTLLLIDVDRFKKFNDLYGHLAGDGCLQTIARVASETTRRSADTVARFGGEEFALILPGTHAGGALQTAERLRKGILDLELAHASSSFGQVTVSIGCATMVPQDGAKVTEIIAAADAALYAAKSAGRNCVRAAAV